MLEDILEMLEAESLAVSRGDTNALLKLFHPDMVWVWPPNRDAHDPADWESPLGRFEAPRWAAAINAFFEAHQLVHNRRKTQRTLLTEQQDGGFSVEDIDVLWQHKTTGQEVVWKGRCAKTFVEGEDGFLIISVMGPLNFGDPNCEECGAES